ncbi:uncharacterized protein LOC143182848 [Calliopsis andreniformis]|uniref:uncharacterized protein LOC143182848 n=1 Tax=Calliopsis andreniformis TaxID=337506 RepID=UPI003FCDD6C5
MLPDYSSCVSGRINTDRSTNLLHAAPIKHDPYTPDSMDSPSPNAMIIASNEAPDVDVDNLNECGDNTSTLHFAHSSSVVRRIDRAVSPALLKSKLELIVRSKKQDTVDMDQDLTDIKRSPSDYCLHSWSNNEERQWPTRRDRCNSDVSWQRSHLLTQAWIQGKGQQGYHSFGDFIHKSSMHSTPPDGEGLMSDLIIPRISIINASNFESNESSVYLLDEKYSNYSENKLSTYSDGRTKSLSGEAFSSEKSDELCEKMDNESNRLNSKTIEVKEGVYLQDINELITKENTCTMMVSTNLFQTKSKVDENKTSDIKEQHLNEIMDKARRSSIKSKSLNLEEQNEQTSQVLQTEAHLERIRIETDSLRAEEGSIKTEQAICSDTNVCNETEILRYDSKNEIVTSKETTRSNSVQSQDTSDNTGSVKLKLKAKVTERCKNNIVDKKSRCQKCCCIVS